MHRTARDPEYPKQFWARRTSWRYHTLWFQNIIQGYSSQNNKDTGICNNTDKPGRHDKRKKPDRRTNTHDSTYMR